MDSEHEAVSIDATSQPYVGRWNRLISTTNWEKGRIIQEWRESLIASEAPGTDYSDEAWSRIVGSVTGQHVGRLRRVFERFGSNYQDYEGLFWSHFQAAVDWDDAEMWLEGAIQSDWSVSNMRRQRWEATGAVADDEPKDGDIVSEETDGDFRDDDPQSPQAQDRLVVSDDEFVAEARSPAGPDFGDEDDVPKGSKADAEHGNQSDDPSDALNNADEQQDAASSVRPFANLAELPTDLSDAFESFKLAILRQKTDEWQEISRDDVLASLDALKELALAPSVE